MTGRTAVAARTTGALLLWLVCRGGAVPAAAQLAPLELVLPGGETATLAVAAPLGYPVVSVDDLEVLGWSAVSGDAPGHVELRHRTGIVLDLLPGSPVLRWDDLLLQMVDSPVRYGDQLFVPLQLVVDLFPGLLPLAYAYDEESRVLQVEGAGAEPAGRLTAPEDVAVADPRASDGSVVPPNPVRRSGSGAAGDIDQPEVFASGGDRGGDRLVVIDPGHGGDDPGAIGPGERQEKDIALMVSLALARELSKRPGIEVRLTRDRDSAVPLWTRGEWATEWKGDRPGAFISIHANALPDRPGVRGFETYFLSEARTEHEQRVAAAENASLTRDPELTGGGADPFLDTILRDLRTFDHQQWSALLADEVQRELSSFHPGPDRGVKQGPLAVITNSLMPSVLVEIGFITNPEEERAMVRPEFQRETAEAIARAVDRFFERYPP